MNAFAASMKLMVEADQARAALKETSAGVRALGAAAVEATGEAGGLAPALSDVTKVTPAVRALQTDITGIGRASTLAGSQVANLGYQFNDIAVMLAAGQNPLMLAMQQGMQISQVIGPMGAAGAVKALGAAFMGMLNPVSLVTIGGIAAGAAMIQWLMGAGEEAVSLEDALERLEKGVDAYAKATERARAPTADMSAEFGTQAAKARELLRAMQAVEAQRVVEDSRAAAAALSAELTDGGWLTFSDQSAVADLFDLDTQVAGVWAEVNRLIGAMDDLEAADSLHAQIAAAEELRLKMRAIAEASGGISPDEQAYLSKLDAMILGLQRFQGARERAFKADFIDPYIAQAQAGLARLIDQGQNIGDANALLASLEQQAEVRRLIAIHGKDSAVVAREQLRAEREVLEAKVEALGVSEGLKTEILRAFGAAEGLAGVNIAAGIAEALGPASRLGALLRDAAGWWGKVRDAAAGEARLRAISQGNAADAKVYSGRGGDPRDFMNARTPNPEDNTFHITPPKASGGGGAGAARESLASLQAEAKAALAELDLAVAAINEKVRLGLMTTAEGAEAIGAAKRKAAGAIAELIPQVEKVAPAAGKAMEEMRAMAGGLVKEIGAAGTSLGQTMAEGFKSPFAAFLAGTKSGKAAFGDFASFVQQKLATMFADKLTTSFIAPLFDGIFGALTGSPASSGTGSFGLPMPFAVGGVPDAPGLAAHADTVVDRPTPFAMSGGRTGVMGEAGPEAIIPLRRGPQGLGVRAMGPAGEVLLPLQRAASGALGVGLPKMRSPLLDRAPIAFARGGVVGGDGSLLGEDAGGETTGGLPGLSRGGRAGGGDVIVNIQTPPGTRAQSTERMEGNDRMIDIIVEQVEGMLASNVGRGVGPLNGAIAGSFGLSRQGS
ncbi:phage tail length tape measure family protein [Paracoccaceae bacterium Fryx2]|nr:phage tail length tape measure family protein [Paracoccaceae bacterium Fryx2]